MVPTVRGVFLNERTKLSAWYAADLLSPRLRPVPLWLGLIAFGDVSPEYLDISFLDAANIAVDVDIIAGEVGCRIEKVDDILAPDNVAGLVWQLRFREPRGPHIITGCQEFTGRGQLIGLVGQRHGFGLLRSIWQINPKDGRLVWAGELTPSVAPAETLDQ